MEIKLYLLPCAISITKKTPVFFLLKPNKGKPSYHVPFRYLKNGTTIEHYLIELFKESLDIVYDSDNNGWVQAYPSSIYLDKNNNILNLVYLSRIPEDSEIKCGKWFSLQEIIENTEISDDDKVVITNLSVIKGSFKYV